MIEEPENWRIPTLRGISEPVTMLGIPPEQASLAIFLGGGVGVMLLITVGFFVAVPAAAIIIVSVFFLFRRLFDRDQFWAEHLTTCRFPGKRYLG